MTRTTTPSARLWVLLARDSDTAVVFRRGPSKQVLLIRWQRGDDSFHPGQWFKGRIHERRCDLSPSGELLLYFAANQKPPYYTWTAISRPPFLTALALWPEGGTWGGGGQFRSERRIVLNRSSASTMQLAPGFQLPKTFKIEPIDAPTGGGEHRQIDVTTMQRDGWTFVQDSHAIRVPRGVGSVFSYEAPEIWSKPNPRIKRLSLCAMHTGHYRREGPHDLIEADVVRNGVTVRQLGEVEWVDWDSNGDLLHAKDGCLFRALLRKQVLGEAVVVLDTRAMRFRPLAAPEQALSWNQPLPLA